ncbi:5'-methylthioadenosine/S-adenosylhomocysteine nucleosidase family protein [Petrachloros mirabilis]
MTSVALFVATRWELAALRRALPVDRQQEMGSIRCMVCQREGRSYWLVQTGVGPRAAKAAATMLLNSVPVAMVISAGFAGALVPAGIGDLIIGTDISSVFYDGVWKRSAGPLACDGTALAYAKSAAAQLGISSQVGSVVSAPAVVCHAKDKQLISKLTGAVALDMESAALAEAAKEQEVPFMILRTVSDLMSEDLPIDFNMFLGPGACMSGLLELIRHPSGLLGLVRLRRQSRLAADQLTAMCSVFSEEGFGLSHTL